MGYILYIILFFIMHMSISERRWQNNKFTSMMKYIIVDIGEMASIILLSIWTISIIAYNVSRNAFIIPLQCFTMGAKFGRHTNVTKFSIIWLMRFNVAPGCFRISDFCRGDRIKFSDMTILAKMSPLTRRWCRGVGGARRLHVKDNYKSILSSAIINKANVTK